MNTICLYLENRENHTILTEMLQDTFRIIDYSDGFHDEPFDLCITDGITLDRNADTFFARKQSAVPLFLPILLLTAHFSPDLFTRDWWEVVDEVLLTPVRKAELSKRIQSLLRSRSQSLALQEEKEALAEANIRTSLGMRAGKISYWEVDLATNEIMLSNEWKAQLDCPDQFDDAREELFRRIHPDDVEPFRNDLQQIIRNRTGTLSDTYRMSCDGHNYLWFILRSTFVNDLQGNPLRLLVSQIDITEQKNIELRSFERDRKIAEAETTIQKHRVFLEAIMKSTTAGIVYVDNEGCVADINKRIADMVGLPENEIIGKKEQPDLWGIIDPVNHSTPPCSSLPVYRSMNEQKIIPPEEYLFKKDGMVKTYSLSAAPVYGSDHEVTGGISIWQDISEKKQIEQQLRQSTERYRTLFESIDEGYCIIEMRFDQNSKPVDYKFIEVNPSFTNHTGIKDAVGKWMKEIIPDLEEYWFETYGKVALTGQPVRFENYAQQLQRWFDVYAFCIGKPEDRQVAVLFNDITSRKKSAEDLLKANELLQNIAMGTEDMIAAQDKNFNYIFFNNAYHRIFKKLWSWELKIGTNMVEALSPWPDQLEKIIQLWTRAFNGEAFRETGEIGPTESSKKFFDMQFNPLRDESGSITGAAHIMRDITESIHARDELRKSQERLVGVLESMPDAFISLDKEMKFTYINRHAESLHHFQRDEQIGKSIREVFNDEESAIKIRKFETVLASQEPETFTLYLTENNGWYEYRSFPNPDGLSVFVKNVSDQKKAEAALKESETRFRALADNISQLAWMADAGGNFFWYNKRWYDYTDTDLEQMKGWGWKKALHPDHVDRVVKKIQHSWDTGKSWEDTFPLRKYDGTYRWFLSRAMPIRDENSEIRLWFGTNTDITMLRETEEKLRAALMEAEEGRNILSALMKNIPLGIIIADVPDVRVRMVSEFGSKMMGKPSQELSGIVAILQFIGQSMRHADGTIPDSEDELPLNRATLKGEVIKNEEWLVIHRDDTETPILCNAGPIRDDKGNITGGVVGWSDNTELRKYRKELEQYAEELATANSDLEAFTYSVSHDLRTPLVTIRNFAQFLLEDYKDKLEEEGRDYIRRIGAGIDKMQAIIDDMLILSRVSRFEIKREDVDLSAMVRNYLQELKVAEPDRQVEFVIQDNVHLDADPRLIHLALENLLRNAWKFTSKNTLARIEFGTVSSASLRHQSSETQRLSDENEARFPSDENIARWPSGVEAPVCFIRDNGIGFEMQFAQKIFEPFKRVHAEQEYGGTGVGLSIVQRVILRHGGKVWAFGEPGKGATFYFTLH